MTTLFEGLTVGGELEPTATYAHRAWAWLPNPHKGKGIPGQDFDGHLSITLQKGRKAGCKIERDGYLVEQQPAPVGFIGRSFLLSNVTDPKADEVYEVHVGDRGDEGSCTCKAGQCRAPCCKHKDALRAAIKAGVFGGVVTREPVSEAR